MLVSNNVFKNRYVWDGSQTNFPISFPFLDNNHIQVWYAEPGKPDTDAVILGKENYTITGAGNPAGGVLTRTTAWAVGATIAIVRNVPITQLHQYTQYDNFPAESHEDALAKLTMIDQQQQEILNRSVKLPATDPRSPEEYAQDLFGARDEAEYWAKYAEKQADRTVQVPSETKVLASDSVTPRTLADRFADVVNVKDFGAKGDGTTDDTEAIQKALNTGKTVYIPSGIYACYGELAMTIAGTRIVGAGMGGGYRGSLATPITNWTHNTTLLFKDNTRPNRKRVRTRYLARPNAEYANDPAMSVGIDVQAEHCNISDICLYLDITLPDDINTKSYRGNVEESTNFGTDLDIGVFVGTRTHFTMKSAAVLGYWRKAGIWVDSTNGSGMQRFPDIHGNTYPESNVWHGSDGFELYDVMVFGARWGIRCQGPMPVDDNTLEYPSTYYDELTASTVTDNRGGFGMSDILLIGCSIYGYCHHTGILFDNFSKEDPKLFSTADKYGGALFVSGMAGNNNIRIQGHRYIATRFTHGGGYDVYLGITNVDSFISCTTDQEEIYGKDGAKLVAGVENNYGGFIVSKWARGWSWLYSSMGMYTTYVPYELRFANTQTMIGNKNTAWVNYTHIGSRLVIGNRNPAEYESSENAQISMGVKANGSSGIDFEKLTANELLGVVARIRFYDATNPFFTFQRFVDNTLINVFTVTGAASSTKLEVATGSWINQLEDKQYYRIAAYNHDTLLGINSFGGDTYKTFVGTVFYPSKDAEFSIGQPSNRWTQVYAASGSIATSDENEKQNIEAYPDIVLDAWGEVEFRQFLFNDAVKQKGESARIHAGVIAQQVMEAFEKHGLDATRYGLLCYDKWEDEYEDVEVEDGPPVLNADGNEVTPAKTHTERRLVTAAGDRYGIRYSEALCIEAAYQRRCAYRLEARTEILEKRVEELRALIAECSGK